VNGSFGSPSTASDGIQEIAVTDDSMRTVLLSLRQIVNLGETSAHGGR
jgi:hypothetical protein